MVKKCSVCIHPDRAKIDKMLIDNGTVRDLSRLFKVSKSALDRHKRDHLPEKLVKAAGAREMAEADSLMDQLKEINIETKTILKEVRKGDSKDNRVALFAIRRLERQLELLAQLMGAIQSGNVQVNVGIQSIIKTPEYATVIRVLDHHPEIRQELEDALKGDGF